jgi:opacity protein-like surface antigen
MGSLKLLALAGALASVTASHALAGDLPPPAADIPDAPAEMGGGSESGIYLRGDIGISINGDPDIVSTVNNAAPAVPGVMRTQEISSSHSIGAGIGYAYNSWLRFDVTGEYRAGGRIKGTEVVDEAGVGYFIDQYDGNLSSAVGLINGYVDLGTLCQIGCITPYVGAGVGMTHNWVSNFTDSGQIFDAPPPGGAFVSTSYGQGEGTSTELAWALMAGVAYQVNDKLTLDLGYRYLNLGEGPAVLLADAAGNSPNGIRVQAQNLDSHDIRIGMRWTLDDSCCGGAAGEPIMRKY